MIGKKPNAHSETIEVNPKYAKGHQWYANYLATRGFYNDSLKEYEKALELDPFDEVTNFNKVAMERILFSTKKKDYGAISQTKKLIELFPESTLLDPIYSTRLIWEKAWNQEAMEQWWIATKGWGIPEAETGPQKDIYKKGRS